MFSRKLIRNVLLALVSLCPLSVKAQDQPKKDQPVPLAPVGADDGSSRTGTGAEVPYSEPEPSVLPDERPITGFQNLSLGKKAADRNILLPSFMVSTSIQSSPYEQGQSKNSGIESTTSVVGRVVLNRTGLVSALSLDYSAGATFPTDPNQGISGVQILSVSESLHKGRWTVTGADQLFYASNSPFGFGGLGGIGNSGVLSNQGSSGLQPGVAPDQSVLVSGEPQVSNVAMLQTSYATTHRSYFTTGVSYGFLKNLGANVQNNGDITVQMGYGYSISHHDSVGVSYSYSRFMYSTSVPTSQGHVVQFTYARQITGRLSFSASGGPSFQLYPSPLAGGGSTLSVAASTSLSYVYGYLSTSAGYYHGHTGGSGVFPGADTDSLTASASRAINRDWSGTLSGGYGKTSAVRQTSSVASLSSPEAFYAGATASRRILQRGSISLSYGISRQLNLAAVCPLAVCQVGKLTQSGVVAYSWSVRPINLN